MEGMKTALFEKHSSLGAKMGPFADYIMPIQYHSVKAEHQRVRTTAGLFDVSHMGEFFVRGEDAAEYINRVTVNNAMKLQTHQAQYSAMLTNEGGVIDDLLIYRFEDYFMVVVNAANRKKDFDWLMKHKPEPVELEDRSDEITLLAVQGRNATEILQKITPAKLGEIKYYWFDEGKVAGADAIISRTGYTGEDGFELYIENRFAEPVWDALFKAGKKFDLEPIGLGARDTLRLEMKFALYGNDIDETTNPIEAGLGWVTKVNKGDFIGRDAILNIKEKGISRKLIGFEINGRVIPRQGYRCQQGDLRIGDVTSGCWSPSLEKGIGMAYLLKEFTPVGTRFEIDVRGRRIAAEVVETPFYKRPY